MRPPYTASLRETEVSRFRIVPTWGLPRKKPQSPRAPSPSTFLTRRHLCEHRGRGEIGCVGFPASPGLVEETMLESLADRLRVDLDRPIYHVAPRSGWMNDPNGPVFHQGEYHLFYQHIMNSCEWDFGIVWGHVVSRDLVHWEHLPNALSPSHGAFDADGCFSGCSVVDTDGTPTILYTGVRLRSNPDCGPLPPSDCDLNLPFVETQLIATAYSGEKNLQSWTKQEEPMIALPPSDLNLAGWRDPYIFETMNDQHQREWGMLLGSGIKDKGGSVMIYRSKSLRQGWRYDGMLCEAKDLQCGAMWECPILLELNQVPLRPSSQSKEALDELSESFHNLAAFREPANGDSAKSASVVAANDPRDASENSIGRSNGVEPGSMLGESGRPVVEPSDDEETSTSGQDHHTHFLCVSPDAPTNPVLYWMGNFDSKTSKFLLDDAKGPLRLDLGDVLYAPNMMVDDKKFSINVISSNQNPRQGRHILWAWLQERRKVGSYDYAGCMCVPRLIYKKGDRLFQEPAPEMAGLRRGEAWQAKSFELESAQPMALNAISGPAVEIQVTFERGDSDAAGILVRSWNAADDGGAALVYDWDNNTFEAVFEGQGKEDLSTKADLDREEEHKRVGGPVDLRHGEKLQMRLLLDGSCVECYLGSGEVLSTRIYRGNAPEGADSGIDLVSFGGSARVVKVQAWELNSIWQGDARMKTTRPLQFYDDDIQGRGMSV